MSSVAHISYGVMSPVGVTLSLPDSTGMQSSLTLLQKNYKFTKVFFWGKLTGTGGDYLIAMGLEESFKNKKFFYCQDGVTWAQLPAVTPAMMDDCAKIAAPGLLLSGDPAKELPLPPDPLPADAEEGAEPTVRTIDELKRVAVTVAEIDMECAMMPSAALMMDPSGKVAESPVFKGMEYSKATSLKSYVFVNKPKEVSVNADAITAATDFLASCDDYVPKGALVCKFDASLNVVCWRSLVYEGFVGYSIVGTPMYGYCYVGSGVKNGDIAFMLP